VNAEIIAVGSELLTPFRQDTNSLYLTEKLNQIGLEVAYKSIVGDHRPHIAAALHLALTRSDVIILIGGLGPTEDDLTREAVADALELPLRRDPQILEALEKRFASRGWKMQPNNIKQADIIQGAIVLPNPNGTAPGQWINGKFDGRNRIIVLLPGPPHELKPMFEVQCEARLRAKVPQRHIAVRALKVTGVGESQCDSQIAPIYKRFPDVQTTLLAGPGEIQIHLRTQAPSAQQAQDRVDTLVDAIEEELGDLIFSDNGDSLEQIVGYYLQMRGTTLSVAESCTGGLLAERLTSIAGSSRYFLGGAVVYSNELKVAFADVPRETLKAHGAVSKETAVALAEGIRKRCSTTFGVGITGIAGPSGGTLEKPVGLVFHALATESGAEVVERKFPGDRQRIRWFATQQALDMVRRQLK
jgi:competence/damage-inducible protein CinA-like protein